MAKKEINIKIEADATETVDTNIDVSTDQKTVASETEATNVEAEKAEETVEVKVEVKQEEAPSEPDPKEIIAQLEKNNHELQDKYRRLYADFANLRKRTAKEKLELIKTASKKVITELLPVVDDFERAFKANEAAGTPSGNEAEGFQLIYNKIKNILSNQGLKPMESIGQAFDPDLHAALTEIPAGDDMKGKVVDEIEKGYYLNNVIIRHAKVVVGK
ncbi:MAG: nucleotide exchange factor GrpE [Chitinophagales bacterium]